MYFRRCHLRRGVPVPEHALGYVDPGRQLLSLRQQWKKATEPRSEFLRDLSDGYRML